MNSNLIQSIAQKKAEFEKYVNNQETSQRDIVQEMDEHLQHFDEQYEQSLAMSTNTPKLLRFLIIWLKLQSHKESISYQEKKCFFFYQWKYTSHLEEQDYLDFKWEQQKRSLIQQKRYPFVEMKKPKQLLEQQLFDLERKQFYQTRHKQILLNLFKNVNKKYRLLKVIAFHRFVRNLVIIGIVPKENKNVLIPTTVNNTMQKNKSRSKSPISRNNNNNKNNNNNLHNNVANNNNNKQNLIQRKMQQMNSAFKISIILMKRELNDYQKLAKALIKWNRFTMKMKQQKLVEELKQVNIILNERAFRENVFRTKIKLAKQDIDSKIQISTQLLQQLIQAQK